MKSFSPIDDEKYNFLWFVFAMGCSYFDDIKTVPMDSSISLNETAIELDYGENFQLDATFIREGYLENELVWN